MTRAVHRGCASPFHTSYVPFIYLKQQTIHAFKFSAITSGAKKSTPSSPFTKKPGPNDPWRLCCGWHISPFFWLWLGRRERDSFMLGPRAKDGIMMGQMTRDAMGFQLLVAQHLICGPKKNVSMLGQVGFKHAETQPGLKQGRTNIEPSKGY